MRAAYAKNFWINGEQLVLMSRERWRRNEEPGHGRSWSPRLGLAFFAGRLVVVRGLPTASVAGAPVSPHNTISMSASENWEQALG